MLHGAPLERGRSELGLELFITAAPLPALGY